MSTSQKSLDLITGRYRALNLAVANLMVTINLRVVQDVREDVAQCVLIYQELLSFLDDSTSIGTYLKGLYEYQIKLLLDILYHGRDEDIHTINKVAVGLSQSWEDTVIELKGNGNVNTR